MDNDYNQEIIYCDSLYIQRFYKNKIISNKSI